jgi:hypothetical protein
MRGHLMHVLMCAPMIVVAAVLLFGGAGVASLVPLVGCMLMMAAMMSLMGGGHGDGRGEGR